MTTKLFPTVLEYEYYHIPIRNLKSVRIFQLISHQIRRTIIKTISQPILQNNLTVTGNPIIFINDPLVS